MTERFIKLTKYFSDVLLQNSTGGASENILLDLIMIIESLDRIDQPIPRYLNLNANTKKTKYFLKKLSRILINEGELNLAKDFFGNLLNYDLPGDTIAEVHLILADIAIRQGDWKVVVNRLRDAKLAFHNRNDKLGEARVENLSGIYFGEQGNIIGAKQQFLEGLQLLNGISHNKLKAKLVINLAIIEIICEKYERAKEYLEVAINIFKKIGDKSMDAQIQYNYGVLNLKQRDFVGALNMFEESIEIAEENSQQDILAMAHLGKSQVLVYSGFINDGKEELQIADKIAERIDDQLTIADILRVDGIIARYEEKYDESEKLLLKGYKLNEELGNKLNAAECALELGILYNQSDKDYNKFKWFDIALKYFRQIKAQSKVEFIEKHLQEEQAG